MDIKLFQKDRLIVLALVAALSFALLTIAGAGNGATLLGFGLIAVLLGVQLFMIGNSTPEMTGRTAQGVPSQAESGNEKVTEAAHTISQVATQQAAGLREQADLIGRTNALLTDFLELSERVRDQARELTQTAKQAAEGSEHGQAAIQQAIASMNEIRKQVSDIATTILALSQFTQKIDDIIGSVGEIATQSNLLALNASIEAARAGAQGRGFAVVAEEVRTLSQQSTHSATQVRAILGQIQRTMREAIQATEAGLQRVDAGMERTQQADQAMSELSANVTSAHKGVNRVYEIIRQQVDGLEEITLGIERVDRVMQRQLGQMQAMQEAAAGLKALG
jgi:methyl-accepting chemotaxis protein